MDSPGRHEPITGYRVSVSDDDATSWVTKIEDTASTWTSATVTEVSNNVRYLLRVAAINDAGVGPWSTSVAGRPAAPPPPPPQDACDFEPTSGTIPESTCWEEPTALTPYDVTAGWQVEAVNFAVANGIVSLRPDGSIGAEDLVNRRDVAEMLYLLAGSPVASEPHAFADEGENESVDWLASLGVVEGVPEGLFVPLRPVYRSEMAVLLCRMSGSPTVDSPHGFPDPVPSWADQATSWAKAEGIVVGRTDGTFDALGTATTAEALAMIHRWIKTSS